MTHVFDEYMPFIFLFFFEIYNIFLLKKWQNIIYYLLKKRYNLKTYIQYLLGNVFQYIGSPNIFTKKSILGRLSEYTGKDNIHWGVGTACPTPRIIFPLPYFEDKHTVWCGSHGLDNFKDTRRMLQLILFYRIIEKCVVEDLFHSTTQLLIQYSNWAIIIIISLYSIRRNYFIII